MPHALLVERTSLKASYSSVSFFNVVYETTVTKNWTMLILTDC